MNKRLSNKVLLKWFIKEEYRVFETLFGSKRLLMFPITLLLLSFLLGASIPAIELSLGESVAVMMVSVGLFGLQTGSIGFEARDTLDNLMGESERILFSSRILPISQKRLAGLFLVKDVMVYSVFMILPIFIGVIIGMGFSPFTTDVFTVGAIGLLISYVLTILSFTLGLSVGFALTTVSYKSLKGAISLSLLVVVMLLVAYFAYTSPSFFVEAGVLPAILAMLVGTVIFASLGLFQFNITNSKKKKSKHSNVFGYLSERLSTSPRSLVLIKTLIDIIRSPGGLWKIVFSTGVISVMIVFLIQVIRQFMVTGVNPSFLYSSLFSLSVFPIYALVYRYDSDKYYSLYPVTEKDVRVAKSVSYLLLSILIIGAYYTIATLTYGVDMKSYFTGVFVFVSLIIYQLGIFLVVARDKPLKFLFNGMMFSGYSISMLLVMIPLSMVGLYGTEIPSVVNRVAIGVCGVCFLLGLVLLRVKLRDKDKRFL